MSIRKTKTQGEQNVRYEVTPYVVVTREKNGTLHETSIRKTIKAVFIVPILTSHYFLARTT